MAVASRVGGFGADRESYICVYIHINIGGDMALLCILLIE